MSEQESPNSQPSIPRKVWKSAVRVPLPPKTDRERRKTVLDSVVLHLHPVNVAKKTLKFTHTFGLGGLSAGLFFILGITGVMLIFQYTPTPDRAYSSVQALSSDVWFGQFIRNLHHWSANAMVLVVALHLLRVFLTGSYHHPREFNWLVGMALLLLTVGSNYTGYLLPWDQLAYWGTTVGSSVAGYVPIVGAWIGNMLLGGAEVGRRTLLNFYGLHTAFLPGAMLAIMGLHFFRVRKDGGVTVPRRNGEAVEKRPAKVTTVPHLVSRELVFALVTAAILVIFAMLVNAPLEEAANPDHSPNPAKAPWYFMGLQELILHFHPTFAAFVIPGLALGALALAPYLDPDMESVGIWFRSRRGKRFALASALIGLVITPLLVVLDEFWLDFASWLPSLPTWGSNGLVPLSILLLSLFGYYDLLRARFSATACEARLGIFVLSLAAFVALTVIGIFFRGEGMALMVAW